MFGRLTLESIPYHEPIIVVTLAVIAIVGLAVVAAITKAGKWQYLWNEWFTSVDHKKLGFMYIALAMVMLIRGFADAVMMRSQQLLSAAGEEWLFTTTSLRPNLYCPWRNHDFLRGNAVGDWFDEHHRTSANWCARCGIPLPKQPEFLAFCCGCDPH